jgi:surface polysaccharide O-acyltransferase-like enzyme
MVAKAHFYHIDLIRLISIAGIIAIHVSGIIFNLHPRVDGTIWSLSLVCQAIFRWGTPLFIMISGYLLLTSSSSNSPKIFYTRRLARLLIPFIFWTIFYYLLDSRIQSYSISLGDYLGRIWRADIYYHLYFLFLIIGLYIITPLLKYLIDRKLNLNILVPLLVTLSYLYTIGAVWFGWSQLNYFVNWFVLYIGYYLAGYWISSLNLKFRWWYGLVLLLPLIGVIADIYFINIFGISDKGTLLTHRLSPLIALPAFVIFLKLTKISNNVFQTLHLTWLRPLADLSMGIYLIHPALLQIFAKAPPFALLMEQDPLLWMVFTFALLVPLSVVVVYLFKKIPLLSRTV